MIDRATLFENVERTLASGGDDVLVHVLDHVLLAYEADVGTIHVLSAETGMLELTAERGLPPQLHERVSTIPIGKGMAGIAAKRLEAVQVCNLQTDESGVAKPGAKETQMEGCLSAPMLVDGALRGTIGVAKPTAHEYSDEETELLMNLGEVIARGTR